jgi:hypothetical protein
VQDNLVDLLLGVLVIYLEGIGAYAVTKDGKLRV